MEEYKFTFTRQEYIEIMGCLESEMIHLAQTVGYKDNTLGDGYYIARLKFQKKLHSKLTNENDHKSEWQLIYDQIREPIRKKYPMSYFED